MNTAEPNQRFKWSMMVGALSIVCFAIGLALMAPGRGGVSVLSDILLLACVPLCIAAGFLGSKHWWWLFLVYTIICVFYIMSHLTFSF